MHQIRFLLVLRPGPRWGELTALPRALILTEWRGMEGKRAGRDVWKGRKGRKGRGSEGRGFFIGFGGWTPVSPNADNAYTKKSVQNRTAAKLKSGGKYSLYVFVEN